MAVSKCGNLALECFNGKSSAYTYLNHAKSTKWSSLFFSVRPPSLLQASPAIVEVTLAPNLAAKPAMRDPPRWAGCVVGVLPHCNSTCGFKLSVWWEASRKACVAHGYTVNQKGTCCSLIGSRCATHFSQDDLQFQAREKATSICSCLVVAVEGESRFPLQIGRMLGVLSLRRTKSKGWTKAMSKGKAYEGMPSDHINDFRTHKLFTEANCTVTRFYLGSKHLNSHFCWGGSIASLFIHWGVRKWFGTSLGLLCLGKSVTLLYLLLHVANLA